MRPPEYLHNNDLPVEDIQEVEGFVIEQGVPLPEDTRGAQTRYPFSQATRTYGKKQQPQWHFVLRYRLENEVSGVRVWRKD